MMNGYFKVVLKDGSVLEMNKMCTTIDTNSSKLCSFIKKTETSEEMFPLSPLLSNEIKTTTLAMVPYENIKYIIVVFNDEEEYHD